MKLQNSCTVDLVSESLDLPGVPSKGPGRLDLDPARLIDLVHAAFVVRFLRAGEGLLSQFRVVHHTPVARKVTEAPEQIKSSIGSGPGFLPTAAFGHFGRSEFAWEQSAADALLGHAASSVLQLA